MPDESASQQDRSGGSNPAEQIFAFLRDDTYFECQEALVFMESVGSRLHINALANFRDVLDHLARAAQAGISSHDVAHHLSEAREHLRRAAVLPLQDEIDDRLRDLDRIARWYFVRQELDPTIPNGREFEKRRRNAEKLLASARLLKGDAAQTAMAVQLLNQCLDQLVELSADVRTSRGTVLFRLGLLVLGSTLGSGVLWVFFKLVGIE